MSGVNSVWSLWLSGFTRRWHMNPAMSWVDDYVCAHQGRCGMLVIALFPDHSIDLLRAAITHDAAESHVGDLSQPFKAAGGVAVELHAHAEGVFLKSMGLEWDLSEMDQARLKMVDQMDAYLFMVLRSGVSAFSSEWLDIRHAILARAHTLGCDDIVAGLMRDVTKRSGI